MNTLITVTLFAVLPFMESKGVVKKETILERKINVVETIKIVDNTNLHRISFERRKNFKID
jgi:hypothetical protein